MSDNLELERVAMLEAFKSDFRRLSEREGEEKSKDPVFAQMNKDNLIAEIKHPLIGEIWDDIKRLVVMANEVKTDEDLKTVSVKAREVLNKIKIVKNSLDKVTEESDPKQFASVLHLSAPDEASKREHEAGQTILGWFYNLAGPAVHAFDAYSGEVDAFKDEIAFELKRKLE